jgi:hypothetical protein
VQAVLDLSMLSGWLSRCLQGAVSGLLLQKVKVGKVAGVEVRRRRSGRSRLVGGEKAAQQQL